jgi:hypothetical protein
VLTPKVTTRVFGLSIPYELPGDQKSGCDHLTDTRCPLDENEDATYVLTMPILKFYPSVRLEIQLEMLADQKDSLFCFKIDCEVVN